MGHHSNRVEGKDWNQRRSWREEAWMVGVRKQKDDGKHASQETAWTDI